MKNRKTSGGNGSIGWVFQSATTPVTNVTIRPEVKYMSKGDSMNNPIDAVKKDLKEASSISPLKNVSNLTVEGYIELVKAEVEIAKMLQAERHHQKKGKKV